VFIYGQPFNHVNFGWENKKLYANSIRATSEKTKEASILMHY
jgi:hypothetical protein